ncbi:hypothetical protein [Novosphingobium rosa]|uniref:hypothetical protein n=1 Tax=Novosphingobium rosa TaxID=76978 RepID=UPI000A6DBF28|nr:hypothetical protein [Novosphingobium rosa]
MSPGKISLSLSLTALAQMAMMSKAEQGRLNAFFANETGPSGPDTKSLDSGAFVSRVGGKRVLWRRRADNNLEIQTIVDESYARSGVKAHAR